MKRLLWRAWDAASVYLPIMLMVVLGLATYWLARSTPGLQPAAAAAAVTHEPDYFMNRFGVKSFDADGRLKNEMRGEQAHHYPDTDTLDIAQPRIRTYNAQGQRTVASATQALSNGDGSQVQLIGNAVVVRDGRPTAKEPSPQPLEFRGEFLHVFANAERLKSHKPVVLIRGQDRFSGDSMEYDDLEQVLQMQGRVRGTLVPAPR